jgi:hypothetical protein
MMYFLNKCVFSAPRKAVRRDGVTAGPVLWNEGRRAVRFLDKALRYKEIHCSSTYSFQSNVKRHAGAPCMMVSERRMDRQGL